MSEIIDLFVSRPEQLFVKGADNSFIVGRIESYVKTFFSQMDPHPIEGGLLPTRSTRVVPPLNALSSRKEEIALLRD